MNPVCKYSDKFRWIVFPVLVLTVSLFPGAQRTKAQSIPDSVNPANPGRVTQARFTEGYGKLPLGFEANRGQSDPQVRFLSHGSGYTLFLTDQEAVLALPTGSQDPKVASLGSNVQNPKSKIQNTFVRMKLVGASLRRRAERGEETARALPRKLLASMSCPASPTTSSATIPISGGATSRCTPK